MAPVGAINKLKRFVSRPESTEYECRKCGSDYGVQHYTCPQCGSYSVERACWPEGQ